MFWGAIRLGERSDLVLYNGDPDSARGGVTARRHLAYLQENLPTVMDHNTILMQDGASIHRAHIVRDWLEEQRIEQLPWPPYSPDLNPIENLWALLKDGICSRYPYLTAMPKNDDTMRQLCEAAIEVWEGIQQRVIDNVVNSIGDRMQAVIDAQGWYTKY